MSCFRTGGPAKEQGTNKPPPIGKVRERSKGDVTCPTISQNPPLWHPSWLNKVCTTRKDSESEWLAKDNPEINPTTIKPETASHVAEQFSWVPLPYCSPPGCPFPIKSLALSARVSPRTIHFWVLGQFQALERIPIPATVLTPVIDLQITRKRLCHMSFIVLASWSGYVLFMEMVAIQDLSLASIIYLKSTSTMAKAKSQGWERTYIQPF